MSTMQTPITSPRFWERQLAPEATRHQRMFDMLFGIIAPIICLVFDPGIFRDGILGDGGMLGSIKWFAYLALIMQVITLTFWLQWTATVEDWIACIAGILMAGALCAAIVGVLLLPLSLAGLFVLIGFLGFIPFLTVVVFARNAFRALRLASDRLLPSRLLGSLVLGVFIAIVLPAALQLYAQYQRPEIETLMTYPSAENVQIGAYEVTDSGFAEEKVILFDTADTQERVEQFYNRVFTTDGWSRVRNGFGYAYESAAGRTYSASLQQEPSSFGHIHVTIHLRRLR